MPQTTDGIQWRYAEVSTLEIRVCPECGITYAGPARFFEDRHEKGGSWYCPNGHSLTFTKTRTKELEDKLANEKRNAEWWRTRATTADQRAEHERSRANGYKGALTKVKRRVGHGVCPCCARTFADLRRHMDAKHPDYSGQEA